MKFTSMSEETVRKTNAVRWHVKNATLHKDIQGDIEFRSHMKRHTVHTTAQMIFNTKLN